MDKITTNIFYVYSLPITFKQILFPCAKFSYPSISISSPPLFSVRSSPLAVRILQFTVRRSLFASRCSPFASRSLRQYDTTLKRCDCFYNLYFIIFGKI